MKTIKLFTRTFNGAKALISEEVVNVQSQTTSQVHMTTNNKELIINLSKGIAKSIALVIFMFVLLLLVIWALILFGQFLYPHFYAFLLGIVSNEYITIYLAALTSFFIPLTVVVFSINGFNLIARAYKKGKYLDDSQIKEK